MNETEKKRGHFLSSPTEKNRLINKLDPKKFVDKYISPHVNPSDLILDVGCGPAVIGDRIGYLYPDSHIVNLDINFEMLESSSKKESLMIFSSSIVGDSYNIPFKSNTFNFVFSRFLLEYLPNPQFVVSEMARVCKPDGILMLQDLDGQLMCNYPEDPFLSDKMVDLINHLHHKNGFDPFVGRKLYHLLYLNKIKNIHVSLEPYHLFYNSIDKENYELWKHKINNAMPELKKAFGSEKIARKYSNAFLEYLKNEETLTFSLLFTSYGVKS